MSQTDHGFAVLCPIAVDNKTLVVDRFEKGAQADFFCGKIVARITINPGGVSCRG